MYHWLVILLETGKSQLKHPIKVAQDLKLKLDSLRGCKILYSASEPLYHRNIECSRNNGSWNKLHLMFANHN